MKLVKIMVVSALTLSLVACMQEQSVLSQPPGTYEKTTSSTNANGTTTENQSSTDVSVDSNGNKKVVVKSKTTKDPRGLLNKTTTSQSTQTYQEKQ